MKNLEQRLAVLENQQRDEKKGLGPEGKAAMRRLYKILREARPNETDIIAMGDRRKIGAMTDADDQLLSLLPSEDLTAIGLRAVDVIDLYAFIFRTLQSL